MTRKQGLFIVAVFAICAARAVAQECVVGWDPMEVGSPPDVDMYAVMIAGPVCGVVVGVLRALGQRWEKAEPVLNLVRFS